MKKLRLLTALALAITCISFTQVRQSSAKTDPSVYLLDTGDVVALYYRNPLLAQDYVKLHAVQVDGSLDFPFGEIEARHHSISEIRKELKDLADRAQELDMENVHVTVVDLRNSKNDAELQGLLRR